MTKSRSVFKKPEAAKMSMFLDVNADELIFPDLEIGEFPSKGDKIELPDDRKPTGKRLMPDESTIKFKNGIVVSVKDENGKEMRKTLKCLVIKHKENNFLIQSKMSNEKIELGDSVVLNNDPYASGSFEAPDGRKFQLMLGILRKVTYKNGTNKKLKFNK